MWWLVALAGVAVGAFATWLVTRWRSRATSPGRMIGVESPPDDTQSEEIATALEHGGSIYLPTDTPDEFLILGTTSHVGEPVPADLARTAAAAVSSSVRAGVEAAQAAGHLVKVDPATARAIREGALAVDKAGKPLAVVRGANGKFEHLARLSPAGKAAGAALGLANVVGAVSTQMQMAAIEAKLSEIVEGVEDLMTIAQRELDSSIFATRQLVAEVVGASRHAGFLPDHSWAMIAPHYKDIIEDQQMARGAVSNLIEKAKQKPEGFWLRTRAGAVETNRDLLERHLHVLNEANLNVIHMHMVRLRHYTVTQPELAPYFETLARRELQQQSEIEALMLGQASNTFAKHAEIGRLWELFHWSQTDDFKEQVERLSDLKALARRSAPSRVESSYAGTISVTASPVITLHCGQNRVEGRT